MTLNVPDLPDIAHRMWELLKAISYTIIPTEALPNMKDKETPNGKEHRKEAAEPSP